MKLIIICFVILDNLRGLLSHQNPPQYNPNHMANFGPNLGLDTRNMTTAQQQAAALQMRYMNNFNANNGQQNGNHIPPVNPAMNAQALQRFQQMNNRQMMNQMRSQNVMPPNMKSTNMRYPPGSTSQTSNSLNASQSNLSALQQLQQQHQHQQAQQQQQHQQQQQQQSSSSSSSATSGTLSGGAKWHTPQQKQSNHSGNNHSSLMGMSPPSNPIFLDSFKIPLKSPDTLKNQTTTNGSSNSGSFPLPNVTSTNPKTPSPISQSNPQKELDSIDSVCSKSVDDLLATIAKLDSNGVQVLPEGRNKATSPQVHSSTDTIDQNNTIPMNDKNNQPKDDPNEDWCACCMDGGELMCCDKCPKVFHQACHIPVISSLPDESETWQCLLCYNFADAVPGKFLFCLHFSLYS